VGNAIDLAIFAALLLAGLCSGRAVEWAHYRRLRFRETRLRDILIFCEGRVPADMRVRQSALVVGEVVIAEDYFKRATATLQKLVGGRLTAYETLLDRGRREAIVRMKTEARRLGADMVFNVRFATTTIGGDSGGGRGMFSAAFVAYGTALAREPAP